MALLLLVAYLAFLAVVVLTPSSAVQSRLVLDAADMLERLGVPPRLVGFGRLEVVANVVMVVPAGLFARLASPRSRWHEWTAFGFLGALTVELAQGLLLPARSASGTDVVANTLGMLVGAVVGGLLRRSRRPGRAGRVGSPRPSTACDEGGAAR